MAEAETARGEVSRAAAVPASATMTCEEHSKNSRVVVMLCLVVSAVVLVADLGTDVILFLEYWTIDNIHWALPTLLLILVPNAVVQVFSLRWHIVDCTASIWHWLSHIAFFGLFHRYLSLTRLILSQDVSDKLVVETWRGRLADLSVLSLFRSFLQSAPQAALQSYCCIMLNQPSDIRAVSLVISLSSLLWATLTYSDRAVACDAASTLRWASVVLKGSWYSCMLAARLAALVLFSVVFGLWTLVPLGIHWAAMTVWIISQNSDFCPTKLEELLYNIVIGFIYCFCYLNLREGRTRYRLITFYTLIITQNLASLFLFMLISDVTRQRKAWAILATVCIVFGTVLGLCSMLSYYRWFHPNGPIKWKNIVDDDIELNNKDVARQTDKSVVASSTDRSLKCYTSARLHAAARSSSTQEVTPQSDIGNTDKKLLLDHWIGRSGTPTFVSAPVGNTTMDVTGVEFHSIEATPQSASVMLTTDGTVAKIKSNNRKKLGICSPTELNLKLSSIEHMESSIDDLTSSNLTLQKRRGICSSDELKDELQQLDSDERRKRENFQKSIDHESELSHDTDSSNKKTSSDSIDMDLELSFSDVNSSDINMFNENIVQKLCLSTLKNIKVGNQDADIQNIQRIALDILKEMYAKKGKHKKVRDVLAGAKRDLDTPTEVLSVHDYENICAVNIAREAWGLRSWNVYSDIENWQHDGSVVRDRRRDTLTSASSEISSCISQELRNHILSAAPPARVPTYSNVFVDRSSLDEYTSDLRLRGEDFNKDDADTTTFTAKPCFTDGAVSHLEPILEEIDDFGDVELPSKPRLNSESSLVATIDEIRKGTITNSPRNVYHRREAMWDSPQMNAPIKIETSLKRALWKEPSKFNHSNILESLQEKENIVSEFSENKYSPCKATIPDLVQAAPVLITSINTPNSESQSCGKNTRSQKMTNIRSQHKKNNTKIEEIHDLSNKDIDFLWQLVSDNALPLQLNSTEDLSASQITSSLQSLIQKDTVTMPLVNTAASQKSNIKKSARNRPRRKFSLLREHFEPKMAKVGDEALYRHFRNKNSPPPPPPQGEPVFDVRFQNKLRCPRGTQNDSTVSGSGPKPKEEASAIWDGSPRNIKEKRSLFLKQVLSPPKFNTKTKHKT